MLKGKCAVIGVTGSIAAYKAANIASMLVKLHCDVHVIMTKNAVNFINPIAFETITGNKCLVDTFDRNFQFHVAHVSLAQKADIFMIAPASADIIGKIASGIADDMLSTTVMATKAPCYISPAMNTAMYENPIVQDNIRKLKKFGYHFIEPDTGILACRDTGKGKLPAEKVIVDYILREIACEKDLAGKRVLVTAGPTQEAIDPVRYISNHSTGKMGFAVARQAMLRGAEVTLVKGPTDIEPPPFVNVVNIVSAQDMFEAVAARLNDTDILIKAAAVADYRPAHVAEDKIKKTGAGDLDQLALERTQDILGWVAQHRHEGLYVCGFSMETQNMLENSAAKLEKKKLDMVVANNLKVAGAGFGVDTNVVTLITKNGAQELPLMSKNEVAGQLLSAILRQRGGCPAR